MIIPQNTTIDTSDDTVMQSYGLRAFNNDSRPIVQNLGPGTLFLSTSSTNIANVGLELPEAAVYELPAVLVEGAGKVYLRAVGDSCDVRIINVG
jgi:hypothetical protein